MTVDLRSPLDGWCGPLDTVPDAVFSGRVMGEGVAVDPTGDCLIAPCDATVAGVHAAGHAVTLHAEGGVEILLHIGIDTVARDGAGFEPLVSTGDVVRVGDPLVRFDLDRLVGAVPAMVTPMIVTSPATVTRTRPDGRCAAGDPLLRVSPIVDGGASARDADGPVLCREIELRLAHGLHARPAARLAAAVRALDATVTISRGDRRASAISSVAMLSLAAVHGDRLLVEAGGPDAAAALDRVAALLAKAGSEMPSASPAPPRSTTTGGVVSLPDGAVSGVPAAPGVVIGPARRLRAERLDLPDAGEGGPVEAARLETALIAVAAALADEARGHAGDIVAAHAELLADPGLRADAERRIGAGAHAAAAFLAAAEAQAALLRAASDRRIAARGDDLVDIGLRVARAAMGGKADPTAHATGTILVADDLLPSHLLAPGARLLAGVALRRGGATSHVAILAAGLGIPMVAALGEAIEDIADGTTLLLDGDAGTLIADPAAAQVEAAERRIAQARAAEAEARAAGDRPTVTACGVAVPVLANLGGEDDAAAAFREGAEGSGLFRTEFLFLARATPPGRDEQAASYRAAAERLGGRPLTIRLLDIGGDKPAAYLALPPEDNPALGERGVRVLLARPGLLDAQIEAILDAGGDTRIMVPMVTDVAEMEAVRARLQRVAEGRGVPAPPLGAMVETPAAALIAGALGAASDFLSIGSNDLAQYALARDRGNPAVAAAADALHPAVLRLIDATCRGAAPSRCPVGLCGGLAADVLAVPILIGLGVRSLSVPAARVAAVKAAVAATVLADAERLATEALNAPDATTVRAAARSHLAARGGDDA